MLDELKNIGTSVTKPFKEEVSLKTLAIYGVLFLIAGWIVFDGLRITASWIASNVE